MYPFESSQINGQSDAWTFKGAAPMMYRRMPPNVIIETRMSFVNASALASVSSSISGQLH
jgi:hypothetical protein